MSKDRGTTWSVTINNPIKADEDNIGLAKANGWKVVGQLEEGKEGTKHYQLMVKTPQVRFSALKKAFPRAHIELARNAGALEQYVTKEDTRVGGLPVNKSYVSLSDLWLLFYDYMYDKYDIDRYGELPIRLLDDVEGEHWLKIFDNFINQSVIDGYNVETMGVNPQIRGCVKRYGFAIYCRSGDLRRQTDRQTQEINIPTLDLNANDDKSQTGSRSPSENHVRWENDEDYEDGESSEDEGQSESGCSGYSSSDNESEYSE